jgi:hypothetical protein
MYGSSRWLTVDQFIARQRRWCNQYRSNEFGRHPNWFQRW